MQAEALMSQLSTYDKTDLIQIHQLTEMLLGNTMPEKQQILDDKEAILFDAVKAELAALGLNYKIPYATLSSSNYYKSWLTGLETVNQFLEQHFMRCMRSKAQRIGVSRIIIQVLLADMKRQHIPTSLGTIARNLYRVPQSFDNQFPNYIQSGLAHLVVQAMTKHK
jgi:hypothetical protein